MKITEVSIQVFTYRSNVVQDSEGHGHPGPEHEATGSLLRIGTDSGAEGFVFGVDPTSIRESVAPLLLGEDPLYRERIWQTLKRNQRIYRDRLTDRVLAGVDLALWDLAGRHLDQPVHKLLGAYREKVPAYASTMCGDDIDGGLSSPELYGAFAAQCKDRGYKAFKLHTWMPPIPGAPDPERDIAACRAVREAVGADMDLMLDSFHEYSRIEALQLGRELEKLRFHWLEEPMDEHSISSYQWLSDQLDIPVVGPETAEGRLQVRAEWIVRGASDISRGGVWDVGGLTALMKIVHLCEAFGVAMEVHGGGVGNLHALCAMGIPGEYYERGLLHPLIDYEIPPPWLNELVDPIDDHGFVRVSDSPGLGMNINFDFIASHTIDRG